MDAATDSPANRIAVDLALAMHQGLIRPGEKLPTQKHLMDAYGVAMGTVSSALSKLAAVGLTRGEPGRGTFATLPAGTAAAGPSRSGGFSSPVRDVLAASAVCRQLAATVYGPGGRRPTFEVGGDDDEVVLDADKAHPPRLVDASVLAGLDRHVLRWMGDAFTTAARRLIATGGSASPSDEHLIAAARAILSNGGKRPEDQEAIAEISGARPEDEEVAFRIWPERAAYGPDDPPF